MAYSKINRIKIGKRKGEWRFNLIGDNGKVVGGSQSESYKNFADMKSTLDKYFPNFPIKEKSQT